MVKKISLTIPAHYDNVALLDMCVKGLHSLIHLPNDEQDMVYLCIVEAINNVIEHSIVGDVPNILSVTLSFGDNILYIEVLDKGKGMNPNILDQIQQPIVNVAGDVQNLPEGGWGLHLIKTHMDKIEYKRRGDNNCFLMVKQLLPT